jgi:hypothetical protein
MFSSSIVLGKILFYAFNNVLKKMWSQDADDVDQTDTSK